jgi:hypothetical protein
MSGYRTWTPGEVITASNVQNYLQDQTVMVFSSSASRGSAIISPDEGMLTWLEDDNKYQYYTGAAWADLIVPIEGGTIGQAYISGGTAPAAFGDMKAEFIATTLQDKTANYTVQASDTNTVLNFTTAGTVTVPDVLTEVGDMIQILANASSGTVVISAGTGVTSWAGAGTAGTAVTFKMGTPYTAAAVLKTDDNAYRVIGRVFA